ncbi:MAG: SDR family oxidoreductase [Acidobacteriota bacterium]|nr:SDR family oxidoreductase [Acidobacteriota bacterium]
MSLYLVTGGSGFIGSHVVDELLRRGERVRALDNLLTGRRENLEHVRSQIEFFEQDIRDLEAIRPAFEGADYVIHLAALPSVPRSVEDPATSTEVNINGTLNVLIAARDAGAKRLVFAASSAAYGDNPEFPRVETQTPRPLSPYGLTKLAGEYYCQIFTRLYGLEAVSLRYFNIFGPRQNPYSPYTGVLTLFISAFLKGKTPTIFGDGEQSRDFTYVANCVEATLLACKAHGAGGKVINVGTGRRFTLNQTVALLNGIFGAKLKPDYGPAREGDVKESLADISLARKVLGFEPRVSYEEGLKQTVEWYSKELSVTP